MNRFALALCALLCIAVRAASAQAPRLVTSGGKSYLMVGKDRLPLDEPTQTPKPSPWLRLTNGALVRITASGDVQAVRPDQSIETHTVRDLAHGWLLDDSAWVGGHAEANQLRYLDQHLSFSDSLHDLQPLGGKVYGIVTFIYHGQSNDPIVGQFLVRVTTAPLALQRVRQLKVFVGGTAHYYPAAQCVRQKDHLLVFEQGAVLTVTAAGVKSDSVPPLPVGVYPVSLLANRWVLLGNLDIVGAGVGTFDIRTDKVWTTKHTATADTFLNLMPLQDPTDPAQHGLLLTEYPNSSGDVPALTRYTYFALPSHKAVPLPTLTKGLYVGDLQFWRGLLVWVVRDDGATPVKSVVCVNSRTGKVVTTRSR